jgi:hypothetical protein
LGFNIAHSSSFHDDPRDKVRTVSNLEELIIKYADEQLRIMDKNPVWIENTGKPESLVGIEITFDMIIEREVDGVIDQIRYIGTIDGIVELASTMHDAEIRVDDNKTAYRLDTAWQQAFDISHQITGYMVGGTLVTGLPCYKSRILGIKSQLSGRSEDYIPLTPLDRTEDSFEKFIDWAIYSVRKYEKYIADIESAPRYTHSCSRYFRPCALIPFCGDTPEGRQEQLIEMVAAPLSPSEIAANKAME